MGTRDFWKQTAHDDVVKAAVVQFRNPASYNLQANPGSEKNMWAGSPGIFPDLVGWTGYADGRRLLWVAEVETEESVTLEEALIQWAKYGSLGVDFYLIVPSGYRALALRVAALAGARITRVIEYRSVQGQIAFV